MSILTGNLKLFGKTCRLAGFLGGLPLSWDPKARRVRHLLSNNSRKRLLLARCYMHTTMLIIVSLQAGQETFAPPTNANEGLSMLQYLLAGICVELLIAGSVYLHACRTKISDIVLYLNGTIQFAEMHARDESDLKQKRYSLFEFLNVFFAEALYWSFGGFPFFFVCGLHWFNPCSPSLALYWLLPECSTNDKTAISGNLLMKLLIFFWNNWSWSLGCNNGVFVVCGIQILGTLSLGGFLETFLKQSEASGDVSTSRVAVTYRQIQLLAKLNNGIQQKAYMSLIIFSAIVQQSFGVTALLKLPWSAENIIGLVVACILVVDTTAAMVVLLGGMAAVNTTSDEVANKLQKNLTTFRGKERRWRNRFYKSCGGIRIYFGTFNFVEQLTPLNCIDFANGLTIQLLLLEAIS